MTEEKRIASTHRSTKGASKARRDQINVEINFLRDLLPLPDTVRERLFQLQVMSLVCIYIRKEKYRISALPSPLAQMSLLVNHNNNYLPSTPHFADGNGLQCSPFDYSNLVEQTFASMADAFHALRGFLLMMTKPGRLLYISDNVADYLGHSVEEIMSQGDNIYDLIDVRDSQHLSRELTASSTTKAEERSFVVRINCNRTMKRHLQYQKPLINPENCEFLTAGNTMAFRTMHSIDMKLIGIDELGIGYLGYPVPALQQASFYHLLHPGDTQSVASKHRLLCEERETTILALMRLRACAGHWLYLHSILTLRNNAGQPIPTQCDLLVNTQGGVIQRNRAHAAKHLIFITHQVLCDKDWHYLHDNVQFLYEPLKPQAQENDDGKEDEEQHQYATISSTTNGLGQVTSSSDTEPFLTTERSNGACEMSVIRVKEPAKKSRLRRKQPTPQHQSSSVHSLLDDATSSLLHLPHLPEIEPSSLEEFFDRVAQESSYSNDNAQDEFGLRFGT